MTVAQDRRWKAEVEIIKKLGKIPSCREMQKHLKEDYNIDANHNTINNDYKKDLESLTAEQFSNIKETILSKLQDEFNMIHDISMNDPDNKIKLEAAGKATRLSKAIAEVAAIFRKAQAQASLEDKPIYNVHIGQPKITKNLKDFKKREAKNE